MSARTADSVDYAVPVSEGETSPPLRIRQSIRTRFLILLLGLTTISVLAVAYLGYDAIQQMGRKAQQTGGATLRTQAEQYRCQRAIRRGDPDGHDGG